MDETLTSPKMAEINLINNLEKISSKIPNRILKIEGFFLKDNKKEILELIIFKGFSSSTTHPIEIDLEKISSTIPNRILKLEGFILKENNKEQLEIIIYKGFSSSTTHPIEIDLEKKL